jgi:trans-AT polyketide synthase, acyltransferase and oxidoreductase domains
MVPLQQGWYRPKHGAVSDDRQDLLNALQRLDQPFAVVDSHGDPNVAVGGTVTLGSVGQETDALPLLAWVPALTPDRLGDPSFQRDYGVRLNYVTGAMANGIASEAVVIAMARAGMLGIFGAAGLSLPRIEAAIDTIQAEAGDLPYGFNLIHSPSEPQHEQATVALYLARGVRVISAAAFLRLTPTVVQFRATGLHRDAEGAIISPNRIIAKVSREEVAEQFLRPAPKAMLDKLVAAGKITSDEAKLAALIPVADDLTAEADSGGHTDGQSAPVLIPLLCALRDRIRSEEGYAQIVRIGAAGGISTPSAVASAFALGAAYVVTGTVNQACEEAGTSPMVKQMLADAHVYDVGMAPASDMFEAGIEVQVLKRGTLFAMRGTKLYELYRAHDCLEDIPKETREKLEQQLFRRPLDEVWQDCVDFFSQRDPAQLERAATDPKHQMALIFRWYLGMSSRWAIHGEDERRLDTQIWCGPGIGAFNSWTAGSFLAEPKQRKVVVVAANLMAGAASITRANWLLQQGINPGPGAHSWQPRPIAD